MVVSTFTLAHINYHYYQHQIKRVIEDPSDNPGRECQIPEEFKDKRVDIHTPPSSVVFLHGNTIHGSYGNDSNNSRPWFTCCYITKGEKYLIGKSSKRIEVNFE